MRTMLTCTLAALLAACCAVSAEGKKEEKIDAKKLVGKWSPKEAAVFTIELTGDGKVTLVAATADGKAVEGKGTYKLEGNKLTATVKVGDKDRTITRTITKLTDTELVGADDKGEERTLVRIRDKK